MDFPQRLRMLRTEKKPYRSMRVTSELIGLPPNALCRYENGEVLPTVESLALLADYFQVSMDFLWGRENF